MAVTHSTAARNAATDAVTALIGANGRLAFRLSGTVGSPGTVVATLSLSATAFPAAVSGTATANAITSYHSTTGAESSLSASIAVTPTAGQRIQVTITPTAAESALYTNWRVYLRRRSTQSRLYLVSSLGTGGNIAIGTTTVYVDLTAAQITALTTAAPSTVENNPPPASAKFVCTYGRRVLVADERNVYWSKQDKADNFPPLNYEPIETGEGDTITGIYPFSDEVALVFTTTAIWGIFGNDPQTWTFKAIDHTIGCLSHLSIIEFNGQLGWWSDAYGPVVYDGTTIVKLGERELGRSSYIEELNLSRISRCWAGHDPKYSRVIWATPATGTTRNSRMFVYNYQVGKFESEQWDPMPAACLTMAYHSDGSIKLFLGSDRGHVFYFDETVRNDGVPSGTVTGTFVGAGALSTISGTGFYATNDGLKGRWVLIVDSDARPVTKVEIASNTSTTLTLATSPTMTTGNVYTYYIGSPDLRLGTRSYDMGRTFFRKRFDRLYVHAKASTAGATNIWLTTQINFATAATATGQSLGLGGAKWGPSNVSVGVWNTSQFHKLISFDIDGVSIAGNHIVHVFSLKRLIEILIELTFNPTSSQLTRSSNSLSKLLTVPTEELITKRTISRVQLNLLSHLKVIELRDVFSKLDLLLVRCNLVSSLRIKHLTLVDNTLVIELLHQCR